MATVQTVLGPIEDAQLGFTLSHEHVNVTMSGLNHIYPWLFDRERTHAQTVRELSEAKAAGIDTLIDLSTPDLGRDVRAFAAAARESGMNVVVATGWWRDVPRGFADLEIDQIADIFVREIEVGIDDTDIRAGAIKVANDAEGVTPEAERVLRAAARACKRTGCPISTHHWAPKQVGTRQVEVLREEGVPMHLVCIGHSADTTDVAYLESLLEAGVYVSMDRYPGRPDRPNWQQRNETVRALVDRGWAERLMLGHDYTVAPVRVGVEPPPNTYNPDGWLFLTRVAIPALLADGVDQATIDTMTREVPRRFLTGASS